MLFPLHCFQRWNRKATIEDLMLMMFIILVTNSLFWYCANPNISILPWRITISCLICEFQISDRTSETLGRGSWYLQSLSLDLQTKICPQIFDRGSWSQISGPQTLPTISRLNPGSNPRPDTKNLEQEFRSSAESFRCATGHLKFRQHTWCSNLLMYINNNVLLPGQ